MLTLAIDIGNTRTKCGLFRSAQPLPECDRAVEIQNTTATDLLSEIDQRLRFAASGTAVVAGSNSRLRDELVEAWTEAGSTPELTVLRSWPQLQIRVDLQTPASTGLDRLLNARGAMLRWPGRAVIIVDSGTATTVDLVADNHFRGGAILPGIELSATALHHHTDALPYVPTESLSVGTVSPIGRSTIEAIHAGVLHGQVGAIRELVEQIRRNHGQTMLVLTGGAANQLGPAFPDAELDLQLGLKALASLGDEVS